MRDSPAPPLSAAERRHDLDWLRIGAFALLILYHIGMLYVPWPWHVKSQWASSDLRLLMLTVNPWRLTLLFVISGVACRYLLEKTGPGGFARDRVLRLLPPVVFGMAVLVVPQAYLEVVTRHGYVEGYGAFYLRYLTADSSLGTIVPTWNHLWFVVYLLLYALIAASAAAWRGIPTLHLTGWRLLLLPAVAFAVYRVALHPLFGETHALVNDAYAHAHYGTAFALGFLIARSEPTWQALVNMRRRFASLALAALAGFLALTDPALVAALGTPARAVVREVYAWAAIAALLGYARVYLKRDGRWRRYLTEAIFPYYILHQTLIIAIWATLQPHALGPVAEPLWLGTATLAGCMAGFEIVRRVPLLRPLFGLKPLRAATPAPAPRRAGRLWANRPA